MIYHNFYSVCALIPTLMMVTLAIIFMNIPKKSKATMHLGLAFIFLSLFFVAYFLTAMFYHPISAYHRFITVITIIPITIHFILVFFYFPEPLHVGFAKKLTIILYSCYVVIASFFLYTLHNSSIVFNFSVHHFDFKSDKISMYYGIYILFHFLLILVFGIWRTIVIKNKQRWVVLAICLTIVLTTIVPAFFNILSRYGYVSRGIYQVSQDIFTITGFYVLLIIYLNSTRDRTYFMVRILVTSLATFLIIFQVMSYTTLNEKDKAYDVIKRKDFKLALHAKIYSKDLEYIVKYNTKNNALQKFWFRKPYLENINIESLKQQLYNARIYKLITENFTGSYGENQNKIKKILKNTDNIYFEGYRNTFLNKLKNDAIEIKLFCNTLKTKINILKKQINQLPLKNFRNRLRVILDLSDSDLIYFKRVLTHNILQSKNIFRNIKIETLKYIEKFDSPSIRRYRQTKNNNMHFTAYMSLNKQQDSVYEAGFSYSSYRYFLHQTSLMCAIMLIVLLLVIYIGFKFFFLRAFIEPLNGLMHGMSQVEKGDYQVVLPIKVCDEIGFITKRFNSMTKMLYSTKQQLAQYMQNLEIMVEERTIDLKQTRDALWGEMQLAYKLQTVLLPKKPIIDGYEIIAYMNPASEVGGDYYDVINIGGYNWIIIGDVSGHGVSAGIIMMMVQTSIHTVLASNPDIDPTALLDKVNRVILKNIRLLKEDMYMTVTVMACLKNGKFYFAGLHQDIIIYRAKQDDIEVIETDGLWIGIFDDIIDRLTTDTLVMHKGDIMLLYTDGITEARLKNAIGPFDPETHMYGQKHLEKVFYKNSNEDLNSIQTSLLESLDDYNCNDDVTIVLVKKE